MVPTLWQNSGVLAASERDLDRNATLSNGSDLNEPIQVSNGVSSVAGGCPRSAIKTIN